MHPCALALPSPENWEKPATRSYSPDNAMYTYNLIVRIHVVIMQTTSGSHVGTNGPPARADAPGQQRHGSYGNIILSYSLLFTWVAARTVGHSRTAHAFKCIH